MKLKQRTYSVLVSPLIFLVKWLINYKNPYYLCFIANQLNRQADYHYGKDLREKPYSLFRIKIDELPAPTK